MPGCVLHVVGVGFVPDQFLGTASLDPYRVFRKGEPYRHGKTGVEASSGFSCDVSDSEGNLSEEFEDALAFLKTHGDDLRRLASLETVDSKTLDFGYYSRLNEKYLMQSDRIPIELLKLVAELGIEIDLSLYARSD